MNAKGAAILVKFTSAAIGMAHNGKKTVLDLRDGATENTTVVRELQEDLAHSGPRWVQAWPPYLGS